MSFGCFIEQMFHILSQHFNMAGEKKKVKVAATFIIMIIIVISICIIIVTTYGG